MKNKNLKFKVFCSTNTEHLTKGLITEFVEEDKPLILEGIASSSNVDLEGDYMTQECLEDMKKQALGISIFLDHEHTLDKIVGKVTHVIESSADLFKIKFSVMPSFEWYLLEFLENGINLGLSIGAKVLDFEQEDDGWKINKVKLLEISIVGIPANPDTVGSVKVSKGAGNMITAKCFNGACKQILDNLDSSDLVKELEDGKSEDDECLTRTEVVNMINEASNILKDQIITEIVSEYKLNGEDYQESSQNVSQNNSETNDENDSSKEDTEKKNMEMDKLKQLVVDTIKELEEAETEVETPNPVEEEVEAEEEANLEKNMAFEERLVALEKKLEEALTVKGDCNSNCSDCDDDKYDSCNKPDKKDKSAEDVVTVKTYTEEEMTKMLKDERANMKEELQKEVEAELFKALSEERKPESVVTDKVKNDLEVAEEELNKSAMTAYEIAQYYYEN